MPIDFVISDFIVFDFQRLAVKPTLHDVAEMLHKKALTSKLGQTFLAQGPTYLRSMISTQVR
jgi:hypothetical protein